MKRCITFTIILLVPLFVSASFDDNLYYGLQNNPQVTELQEFLTEKGFYSGPITGNFFSLTFKAVKDFQTANSISPVSGYFGPLTQAKANEFLSQVTDESGAVISPAITPPKTSDDVVAKLTEQIQLLLNQIAELQKQQTALTAQTQILQNIQTEQRNQSLVLGGIETNTAPSVPNPVVVRIPPPPPVPTKLKLNRWENNGSVTASGAACETVYFEASVSDQYGEYMRDQKVTITTPIGTLTSDTNRFWYTPTSTSTQETVTFTSGNLSFSGKIYVQNRLQEGIDAGKAVKSDDGKWTIPAWSLEFDPVTKMCTNNLATKTSTYIR